MNKFLINTILILILLFIFECYSYSTLFVSKSFPFPDYGKYEKVKKEFIVDNHLYTNYEKPQKGDPIYFEQDGRSFVGENYTKRPILLLGDSYTYGLGLKKEETFGYQLSEYTKRPVHNWAWCTEGLEYSVLEMKEKENFKRLNGISPEYVIYTYGYSAPGRLTLKQRLYRWFYLRQYSLLGNQKFSIFDNLFSINFIKNTKFYNYLLTGNSEEKIFKHLSNLIFEIKKDIDINFKNAKFVVLVYSDSPDAIKALNLKITDIEEKLLDSPRWKELEKASSGKIIVLSTEELIGRKMNQKDDLIDNERTVTIHPSASAWAEIVPAFAKKLNLN